MLPLTYHLGSVLLRGKSTRRLLNQAYEKMGPVGEDLLNVLFDGAKISGEFQWQCRFGDSNYLLPVFSAMPRSWANARAWRWSGNRCNRRIYEVYIRHFGPGVLLDIGANDGTHTYPFAANGFRCFCFEPQPLCGDYIRRVCKLNNFENAILVQGAVSNQDAQDVSFFVSNSSWYSSLAKENVERFEPANSIKVKTLTVDSYCNQHQLQPTLVKIDVEGGEWEVVAGGREMFSRERPDIFMEISTDAEKRRMIWEFFHELAYRIYFIQHAVSHPLRLLNSVEDFLGAGEGEMNGDFLFLQETRAASLVKMLT